MYSPPEEVEQWERADCVKFWLALGAQSAVVEKHNKVRSKHNNEVSHTFQMSLNHCIQMSRSNNKDSEMSMNSTLNVRLNHYPSQLSNCN